MAAPRRPAALRFERFVTVDILGRKARVPEGEPLLRGFQQLCPEAVSRGRFCWNHECGSSKFYFRTPGSAVERKARACRQLPVEGMVITTLSAELKHALRAFLDETPATRASAPAGAGEETDGEEDPFPEIRFKND